MPISPDQGSSGGGTTVTVTGVNLAGATAVTFGVKPGTITANTPTSVSVTSPSGSGAVEVTVTTAGGTSNPLPFYYIAAPFVTALSSNSGPTAGGNTVSISGLGLATASNVSFGSNSATPTVVSDSMISVVVPAGTSAGSVEVTVTTAGGRSDELMYTYVNAPTISTITPSSGPTAGGTSATAGGTGFTTTQSVTVGGVTAAFAVINDTTVSIVTPPGTAGAADVVVTTSGGSATLTGGYTYVAAPGI